MEMQLKPPISLLPERESALIQDLAGPARVALELTVRGPGPDRRTRYNFSVDNPKDVARLPGNHGLTGSAGRLIRRVEGEIAMKFAAYTEETIWAVEDSEEEARAEGEATMQEMGASADAASLKVAPIDEDLVEALAQAEQSGADVLFDLIDGELCEVEAVE